MRQRKPDSPIPSVIGYIELTACVFRRGLFFFSQKVIPSLLESVKQSPHPPSLILTGATASMKGSSNFSTLAAGKFASRAIGQSLAREFGPQGVHVAHVIVDGVIDVPKTKEYTVNGGVEGGKLDPEAVSAVSALESLWRSYGTNSGGPWCRLWTATGTCIPSPSLRLRRSLICVRLWRSFKAALLVNS